MFPPLVCWKDKKQGRVIKQILSESLLGARPSLNTRCAHSTVGLWAQCSRSQSRERSVSVAGLSSEVSGRQSWGPNTGSQHVAFSRTQSSHQARRGQRELKPSTPALRPEGGKTAEGRKPLAVPTVASRGAQAALPQLWKGPYANKGA